MVTSVAVRVLIASTVVLAGMIANLPDAIAQGEALESPGAAADVEVEVRPIDGESVTGQLESLDGQTLSLSMKGGGTQTWPLRDLRSLRVNSQRGAIDENLPVVLLANGDVFEGAIVAADEDKLTLEWTAVAPPQSIEVPLETVRSFAFQQPEDELDQLRLRRIWALLEPDQDRLISTDATHIDGEFLGVAEGQVRLDSSLGAFSAPVEEVIAVVMNSELVSLPEPEGPYAIALFRDGSRVTFASLELPGGGQVSGSTVSGAEVSFPLEQLSELYFFGGRVMPIVDLTPTQFQFTPYLTQLFPLIENRNVYGGRLKLRGRLFATGLGVSSKSEVTYDLSGGNYTHFETAMGIDDMTGGQGNVVFAVEVDGRRVYESAALSGRSPAESVGPLDVSGAGTLKLVVEFGESANIQDVADWGDPVLIKSADR